MRLNVLTQPGHHGTMPVIDSTKAPVFTYTMPGVETKAGIPHLTVRGLASPSRGSTQTCVWRMTIAPDTPPRMGVVSHEEIFVLLSGNAVVTLDEGDRQLNEGDTLIMPPNTTFGLSNPHDKAVEMMVILPVGGKAIAPGMEPFTPPWAE